MKKKMTPWFRPSIKPVHVGDYPASVTKSSGVFRFWNGKKWSRPYFNDDSDDLIQALRGCLAAPAFQWAIYWRGLAEDPMGKK